jgi:hypothetical protein
MRSQANVRATDMICVFQCTSDPVGDRNRADRSAGRRNAVADAAVGDNDDDGAVVAVVVAAAAAAADGARTTVAVPAAYRQITRRRPSKCRRPPKMVPSLHAKQISHRFKNSEHVVVDGRAKVVLD